MCYAQIISDKLVQAARKKHICDECGKEIQPGQSYKSSAHLFEGDFYTVKMCVPCREVWKKAWRSFGGEMQDACVELGGIRQALASFVQERRI